MNARVENAPGARCASRYAPPETTPAHEHRGDPGAVQRGEADGGRDVEQQEEAEHPVGRSADLEELRFGGRHDGHVPVIDRNGHILQCARSLASQRKSWSRHGKE